MNPIQSLTLALFEPTFIQMIILAAILLLFFGKRLPEVGRSLGRGIVEFKKGLAGVEDDANRSAANPPSQVQSTPPTQITQQSSQPTAGQQSAAAPAEHSKTQA